MPYAVIETNSLDTTEWPVLGRPAAAAMSTAIDKNRRLPSGASTAPGSSWCSPVPSASNKEEDAHQDQQQKEDGDWENLQPLSPQPPTQRPRSVSVVTNVAMVDMNHLNKKILRHSASSPDLRQLQYRHLSEVGEEEDGNDEDCDEGSEAVDASFALISGPGSVMSFSSGVSFRDAILSPGAAETISEDGPAPSSPPSGQPADSSLCRSDPRKPRARPRFVVKPIRRCSKSTGDLQSLAEVDEEAAGHSDAMEFYHRKALGAKGRANGLKIRPDELKRKQFTIQKKQMQRQGQR